MWAQESLDEVQAGIQEVVDRQAAARAALDREAFTATIDQRNLVWRRIQNDIFASAVAGGPQAAATYLVTQIQPKQGGYVKAWIEASPPDVGAGGGAGPTRRAVWVFRQTESGWLHTEVLNEEIGPRRVMQTEHFGLSHYAWDEDVIERVGDAAEMAHAKVAAKLGKVPAARVTVSVNPTFGSNSSLQVYGVLAAYPHDQRTVLIRSLESFGAGYTSGDETAEQKLGRALTHEYTHLVNDLVVSLVKVPLWMSEGLAQVVSEDMLGGVLLQARRAGRVVPLERADEMIAWGTNPEPSKGFTLNDVALGYAGAAWAVAYFLERFGIAAFWDVSARFADTRRWEESFAGVTAMEWSAFGGAWMAYADGRLGA